MPLIVSCVHISIQSPDAVIAAPRQFKHSVLVKTPSFHGFGVMCQRTKPKTQKFPVSGLVSKEYFKGDYQPPAPHSSQSLFEQLIF